MHPDAVFSSSAMGQGVSLSSPPQLAEEVQLLANSLAIPSSQPGQPYDADAFVMAIRREHDKLMAIKGQLMQENERQRRREVDLQSRECAVQFREQRMAAYERLVPQRPFWKLLSLWRGMWPRLSG